MKKNTLGMEYKKRSAFGEVWHRFKKNKGAVMGMIIISLLALIAITADLWIDYETDVIGVNILDRLQGPSTKHPFGTDEMGRDLFFRLLYGTRFSLSVGVASVTMALVVGIVLGSIAGYFGGITDNIIMRIMDIFSSIPTVMMAIVVVSVLGASTINLMIAVGITSVPQFVRITRASVITVCGSDYVESARAIGKSEGYIIFKHVLPNSLSPIIVQTTLRIASAIVTASSLSFLGLGIPAPSPEWGALLSAGRAFIRGQSYMTVFPGLAIMVTVLAFNLMGDGLRDAMDPKLKK